MTRHLAHAFLALCLSLVGSPPAFADAEGEGKTEAKNEKAAQEPDEAPDPRILSPRELRKALMPHEKAIGDCYKRYGLRERRSTGVLRLELIIHRDGHVHRLNVVAPGVRRRKPLVECLTRLSKSWRFPEKPGFTHAVVPFFYLRTRASGAGPMKSCWSAKGCPELRRKVMRERGARDQDESGGESQRDAGR